MALVSEKKLPKPSATYEQAHEAARSRKDLTGSALLEQAWGVGPDAVIALCLHCPTGEQEDQQKREERRRLKLKEVRRVAALAREAKLCIDGELPGMDDSTRRDVVLLVQEFRHEVELLAWWSALDARRDIATKADWRRVYEASERQAVKELLTKTGSAIKQAVAESHVPKKRRKNQS
jgi:hypothetical protein